MWQNARRGFLARRPWHLDPGNPGRDDETAVLDLADKYRLEARLEAMCEKGCRHVWQDIDVLERGEDLPETRDLNAEDRDWLLRELKQVMAVYADRCSID